MVGHTLLDTTAHLKTCKLIVIKLQSIVASSLPPEKTNNKNKKRNHTFFVLDLGLDILNGIAGLNFQRDSLASQGFDKDLHTSPQSKHQVEGRFFLNVVVRQGSSIFKLLASEDETLLVRRDS